MQSQGNPSVIGGKNSVSREDHGGHRGDDVFDLMRSTNKSKSLHLHHACQSGEGGRRHQSLKLFPLFGVRFLSSPAFGGTR